MNRILYSLSWQSKHCKSIIQICIKRKKEFSIWQIKNWTLTQKNIEETTRKKEKNQKAWSKLLHCHSIWKQNSAIFWSEIVLLISRIVAKRMIPASLFPPMHMHNLRGASSYLTLSECFMLLSPVSS